MTLIVFSILLLGLLTPLSGESPPSPQFIQSKAVKWAYIENYPAEKLFLDFYADFDGKVTIKQFVHLERYIDNESLIPVYVKLRHIYAYFEKAKDNDRQVKKNPASFKLIKSLEIPAELEMMSHIRIIMDTELILARRNVSMKIDSNKKPDSRK